MATLDLSQAKQAIDMTDPDLVNFSTLSTSAPTRWSWFSPGGHEVDVSGVGLTFDAAGHATGGVVTSIGIDLGNNNFDDPDIIITGLNAAAAPLDNSAATFWRVLEGDDTIIGPSRANAGDRQFSVIFGDGIAARAGTSGGGNDTIDAGDAPAIISGDVVSVGRPTPGSAAVAYAGGDDVIAGRATTLFQHLFGDARVVLANGTLAAVTCCSSTLSSSPASIQAMS